MEREDVPRRARDAGKRLSDGLLGLPHVTGVRGLGLLLAAELDDRDGREVAKAALDAGLVVNGVSPTALDIQNQLNSIPDLTGNVDVVGNAGGPFEIIFSNGHDVYVESLDADGQLGPAIPVQIAAPANLLLVQVSIASSGHGYLAAWNTANGTLSAATISDAGEPGAATTVATPSAGKQIRRPRLAWNGPRYACVYLDGGGNDYRQVIGTPNALEIDPQTMTTAPHDISAPESVDVSVAAAPDRWFASWTDRSGGAAGSFADEEAELYLISSGATAERVAAAASNGTSTLVTWLSSLNSDSIFCF